MIDPQDDEAVRGVFCELGFITGAAELVPVLRQAKKAACVSDITVLLEGETGTGKQVLATAIHALDQKRARFPFVTVHCSTINESLAESELFGHEKGAFSGASQRRLGLFHAAHRGTLFLDDVNDLPLSLQPKLLDALQRGAIRPVGSDREHQVDVRIISAVNQPLAPLVQQGRFRSDLYHRLNVVRLSLPPLRERRKDLAELMLAFAGRHSDIYPGITSIDLDLIRRLESCPFHGNVRELEHCVERMLFGKTEGTRLELSDWMAHCVENTSEEKEHDLLREAADTLWKVISQRGVPYAQAIRQIEKRLLQTALLAGAGTRRELACRLQTSERTLYHKLRNYSLTSTS